MQVVELFCDYRVEAKIYARARIIYILLSVLRRLLKYVLVAVAGRLVGVDGCGKQVLSHLCDCVRTGNQTLNPRRTNQKVGIFAVVWLCFCGTGVIYCYAL